VVSLPEEQEGRRLQHRNGQEHHLGAGDKISFIDETDDHPYEVPTYGVAGWSKDGKSVIVNHRYDLYSCARRRKGGESHRRRGRRPRDCLRVVRLDRSGGGGRGVVAVCGGFGAPAARRTTASISPSR